MKKVVLFLAMAMTLTFVGCEEKDSGTDEPTVKTGTFVFNNTTSSEMRFYIVEQRNGEDVGTGEQFYVAKKSSITKKKRVAKYRVFYQSGFYFGDLYYTLDEDMIITINV